MRKQIKKKYFTKLNNCGTIKSEKEKQIQVLRKGENKKMSEIDLIGNTIMIGMIVFVLLCLFIERFRP